MSDAICGPSNPLQQFKQQTQFDRTLQQDRLTSRHSPAQGFRSADPNAGILDPEFEAFQAGLPPSEFANLPAFSQHQPGLHAPPAPSQAPAWAADFQRMHISSPLSFQQPHLPVQTTNGGSNWTQGFREHLAQAAPRPQQSAPSPQAFQYMARYGGMNGFQTTFSQPSFTQPVQSKGKQAVVEPQFDDAAFEAAFDQARNAIVAKESNETTVEDSEGSQSANQALQDDFSQLVMLEQQNRERLEAARQERGLGDRTASDDVHQAMSENEAIAGNSEKPEPSQYALQDFQMQLMLLEQQNKKRLEMARLEQGFADKTTSEDVHLGIFDPEVPARYAEPMEQEQLDRLQEQNKTRTFATRVGENGDFAYEGASVVQEGDALDSTDLDRYNFDSLLNDPVAEEMLREDQQVPDQQQDDIRAQNNDDALAATAEELLQKVSNNTTDKFRNSQFLGLMRRLRDREVKVEGDKMVEVESTTAGTALHFDNSEQTPHPVDSRPIDYSIPAAEQDLDAGRHPQIDLKDGQEVVDLLSQPEDAPAAEQTHDIGTSSSFPEGVFYGDLRQRGWSEAFSSQMEEIGSGASRPTPLSETSWSAGGGGYRQPPPRMP